MTQTWKQLRWLPRKTDPGPHDAEVPKKQMEPLRWELPHLGTPPPAPEFRRFTRGYEKQRNDNTYLSGSKETARFEFSSGSEGRGTKFHELAWLILNLKETITHQTSTIENIRADLTRIKEEQQNLTRQNAELQEQ
ncbi:hypothetical protein LTR72_012519, partial [Exophiala xenobiotica]